MYYNEKNDIRDSFSVVKAKATQNPGELDIAEVGINDIKLKLFFAETTLETLEEALFMPIALLVGLMTNNSKKIPPYILFFTQKINPFAQILILIPVLIIMRSLNLYLVKL